MDLPTIIGLVVGFGGILGGQALEGGHIGSIIQGAAAVIVFGGTIGAGCVAFPANVIKKSLAWKNELSFTGFPTTRLLFDSWLNLPGCTSRRRTRTGTEIKRY